MNESDMMHGMAYNDQDVTGWIATEKLDGIRAYWDGAYLWTRGGKRIITPAHWALPSGVHLDGELFAGYGNRQLAVNAARYGRWDDRVRFVAFDAPKVNSGYIDRLKFAFGSWHDVVGAWPLIGISQTLKEIQERGGEGLMIRHPELVYMPGRTDLMLKIK